MKTILNYIPVTDQLIWNKFAKKVDRNPGRK